jgi:hypothetical protein
MYSQQLSKFCKLQRNTCKSLLRLQEGLLFGKELRDNQTIAECNIQNESIVYLVLRLTEDP